jgi:hypothetical protein
MDREDGMTVGVTQERNEVQQILDTWDKLTNAEKERVIPVLLDRTRTWHSWATYDDTIIDWLQDKFASAGVAFRNM